MKRSAIGIFFGMLLIAIAAAVFMLVATGGFASEAFAAEAYDGEPSAVAVVSAETDGTDGSEQTDAEPEESADNTDTAKAIAAAAAIGVTASAAAIAMAIAISKTSANMARQPEIEGKLRTNMLLGLVFIETVVIYALIIGILVVFVL